MEVVKVKEWGLLKCPRFPSILDSENPVREEERILAKSWQNPGKIPERILEDSWKNPGRILEESSRDLQLQLWRKSASVD